MQGSDSHRRYMITALLKGVCFLVPLLLISVALKLMPPYGCESVPCVELSPNNEGDQPDFYFIGTSRVQRSISPAILKADLPHHNFVNLGLSNNSFLYACQAASNLIKNTPGKKVIFIELTGMAITPSDSYYLLLTPQDVPAVFQQHLAARRTSEDVRGMLFFSFSIHGDIKKTLYPRLKLNSGPAIGFLEDERDSGSLASMLTPETMTKQTKVSPDVLNTYLDVIANLSKQAAEKNDEVQFILPLMIYEQSELAIDMAVFSQLPEKMKWSYQDAFLTSMHNPRYLSDQLHLNSTGATLYSHELSKFIRQRFLENSEKQDLEH